MLRARSIFGSLIVLTLAGCGLSASSSESQRHTVLQGQGEAVRPLGDVAELAPDSPVIVVAEAEGSGREVAADSAGSSGEKSTVTTMRVLRSFKGPLSAGSELQLRQFGTRAGAPEEIASAGGRYLLLVQEFTFADQKPTGQWVTTGALFQATNGEARSFRRVPSVEEPENEGQRDITEAEVVAASH